MERDVLTDLERAAAQDEQPTRADIAGDRCHRTSRVGLDLRWKRGGVAWRAAPVIGHRGRVLQARISASALGLLPEDSPNRFPARPLLREQLAVAERDRARRRRRACLRRACLPQEAERAWQRASRAPFSRRPASRRHAWVL